MDIQQELFAASAALEAIRVCVTCQVPKVLASEFYANASCRGGYQPSCKDCDNARKRRSEAEHRAADPDYEYKRAVWRDFRLRWPQYEEMLARQLHRCAVCADPFTVYDGPRTKGRGLRLKIHVDHDHGCDHPDKGMLCCAKCVRGVVCRRCNMLLGWLETHQEALGPALRYLGENGLAILAQAFMDGFGDRVRALLD